MWRPSEVANQPLIIDMHGWGGTAEEQFWGSGLGELAEEENFTVIYSQASNEERLWSPEDASYIEAAVDHMLDIYSIDESRIYATGCSAGGAMSHYLGAAYSQQIAAIVPIGGLMPDFPDITSVGGIVPDAAEIVDFRLPPDPPRAVCGRGTFRRNLGRVQ